MCPSAFRERLFSTFFQNPLFVVTRINLIGKLRPFLAKTQRNSPTILIQNQRNLTHVRFTMKLQPSSATSNWSCIISLSLSSSAGSCMDLNAHNQLWIIFRCNYYYTFALLAPLLLNHRIYSIIPFLAAAFLLCFFLSLRFLDLLVLREVEHLHTDSHCSSNALIEVEKNRFEVWLL